MFFTKLSLLWFSLGSLALAGDSALHANLGYTQSTLGVTCLVIFALAYLLVVAEEFLHLRKSIPVVIAAGLLWGLVGSAAPSKEAQEIVHHSLRHYLLEFGELFLFLLAAMTFINTMEDRGIFRAVRAWLVSRHMSLRSVFWITGLLAFWISPLADNLTTALLMGAVILAVGHGKKQFLTVALVNVVVASNAGGAFSPFGDITTLMVWQAGQLEFLEFFRLILPSLVNWLIPAAFMSLAVGPGYPEVIHEKLELRQGAWQVVALFLFTVALAVCAHALFHLPPVLGMTTGLGLLKLYGTQLQRGTHGYVSDAGSEFGDMEFGEAETTEEGPPQGMDPQRYFDVFRILEKAEWDTLMFFYGIILCVGALGTLGYLSLLSTMTYGSMGTSGANIFAGLISAVIDNIPVMVAVLAMDPAMSQGQWLLVTLTAGTGGSLLSVGSAAGVALMGQAGGAYTFASHLRWTWAIALGYFGSVAAHFWVNGHLM